MAHRRQPFAISKTISGVILDPGGLHELHRHSNPGQLQTTLFGSKGRYRVETRIKGDVAYIPRGFGHSIENERDGKPTRILMIEKLPRETVFITSTDGPRG
ncbi:MAG TPA: hypothetical protein VGZ22_25220 [Isosphaeraceae bacterium]|jgi:oxalate decarboxylase|nr:hypothetical protein [Isosphaeraceae bacterium]